MRTRHFVVGLFALVLTACAAHQRDRPVTGPVTTTSAVLETATCKESLSICYHDSDCCTGFCDYDQSFCH